MRPILAILILLAAPADRVPDFRLETLDGRLVRLSELQGERLTVIDFWATWCGPCTLSMPALAAMSGEFADRGVRFVGVNVDSPRNLSKVAPVARSLGVTYPVLLDGTSEVMGRLGITAMPTLLVIDRKRDIVFAHEGFRPGDERVIRGAILRLLAGDGE